MDQKSGANSKIYILYLASKVPGSTYNDVMELLIENFFIDYFDFSRAVDDLKSGNMLELFDNSELPESTGNSKLHVTPGGEAILKGTIPALSQNMISSLDEAVKKLSKLSEKNKNLKAYFEAAPGGFIVTLYKGDENGLICNFSFRCSTKEKAEAAIRRFRENPDMLTEFRDKIE